MARLQRPQLGHQLAGGERVIEIVTGTELNESGDTDEVSDTFDGPQVSFITEPSGALVVFEAPNRPWAAYAPGEWKKVRNVRAN